jgi:hypothetical protein
MNAEIDSKPETPSKEGLRPQGSRCGMKDLSVFIFLCVLLFAIGFRIYKMHNTGIIFDEVWTYEDFCTNLHTAITNYSNTNNHVLNSVFIVLAQKLLGGYEHFLRVPATLFGILFCCAIALILYKTLQSRFLKIAALLLILQNWFVLDLTYLARGYAIAMGATFASIAVLLYLGENQPIHTTYRWCVVIFLIIMNFLAMGSMLSSLPIVLSINLVYGLWIIIDSVRQGRKAVAESLIRLCTIAVGSILSLLLLYYSAFSGIRKQSKVFEATDSFGVYLGKVLWEPLIFLDFGRIRFNMLAYKITALAVAVCAIVYIVQWIIQIKSKQPNRLLLSDPAVQILFLFATVFFLMWIQRVIFDVSLGMPRNGVFLTVLMLLGAVVVMDRAVTAFSRVKIVSYGLCFICSVLMAIMTFLNWSSCNAVYVHPYAWAIQSSVGPLVRQLRQIDPDKTWKIKLTKDTENCFRPLRYYKQFGYHAEVAQGEDYDVYILPKMNLSSRLVCLDYERFTEHHCCVVVNPASFQDKRVFYEIQVIPQKNSVPAR